MQSVAVVATESQLGRSKNDTVITRPSLMKELVARGIRITAQRRLLVNIIQDSPRHLDAATLLELPGNTIRTSIALRSIGRSRCLSIAA